MPLWLAAAVGLIVAASFANLALGMRRLRRIDAVPPTDAAVPPRVSVVVAARNEARGIEAGLRSLLAQEYPNLEVVVVDDRSTDQTSGIVRRIAATDHRVVSIRIDELPKGWLGKNHALFVGARRATGEWLLFTDADVVIRPETLTRAIGHALRVGRDHVTITPSLDLPGAMLQGFVAVFGALLFLWKQPWRAPDPRSRSFIGIGAFNLVRRSAYDRAGTHERIALRPDDDLKLAKIIKLAGGSSELLDGCGFITVEWYRSVGELVRGLEKNAFAGLEYRVGQAIGGAISLLALMLVPLLAVAMGPPSARWVGVATIVVTVWGFGRAALGPGVPRSRAVLYPAVVLLFVYIVLRTMMLNLAQGGIRWRDTFYPLDALRNNRV